ncbi:hypothetical protein AJ80_07301 [Polytolypa hystricis UAMH7299]|uniref:Uncharacterized protein n=1 Tax=Polytolypa hystricis (strain UAMH7299) TaxID=1447883 RepID=A0A2B7XPY1_POLH7|nr:hypothetical protein AJ80_07301 [Polytolypa hystricis UAMH7299]
MHLYELPQELFLHVIEHLVQSIGIVKALRLRLVDKKFEAAMIYMVCTVRALDITNLTVYRFYDSMSPPIRAKFLLAGSRSKKAYDTAIYSAIAWVNSELDLLTQPTEELGLKQHHMIAEAVAQVGNRRMYQLYSEQKKAYERTKRQNLLCGAVVVGSLSAVKAVMARWDSRYLGVNRKSYYFGRPLHVAAAWGHLELVQYFLDNGADPRLIVGRAPNDDDWRPNIEHVCLWSRHVYQSPDGTPLRAAALSGHEDIVRLLLKPEYRLPISSPEYYRAILAAARGGYMNIIGLLLEAADKNLEDLGDFRQQMLFEAVRHNQEPVVRILLDNGTDVNALPYLPRRSHGTALHIAAAHNRTEIIRLLLDRGASQETECPWPNTSFPIDKAAQNGHEEAVELLLERGSSFVRALASAASGGQVHLVQSLMRKGIDIHMPDPGRGCKHITIGMEALNQAIAAQNLSIIAILVNAGVPINPEGPDAVVKPHESLSRHFTCVQDFTEKFLASLGGRVNQSYPFYIKPSYDHWSNSSREKEIYVDEVSWEWVGKY